MYTYEALFSSGTAPTAGNVEAITQATVTPPLQHYQARYLIHCTAIVLQLAFGANHALVTMLNAFCIRYTSLESKLWSLEMTQSKELLPTMICCYVGLRLNMWFTKIRTLPNATLPDILECFNNIMMDENWEKPVPMAVLSQLGLQHFHSSQKGQSASGGRGVGGPNGGATGSSGSGGGQGGSTGGSGTGTAARSVHVNNTEFNSMYQHFTI